MLTNIDYLMEPTRPLMPHVIPIPGLFVKEPEQIQDSHLRTFMDAAEEGVVVIYLKLNQMMISSRFADIF